MTGLLGLLMIALIIWIIFLLSKANEFVSDIKGEEHAEDSANRFNAWMCLAFLILGMIGFAWSVFHYAPMFLPPPASEHGAWIRQMFQVSTVPIVIVFFITHVMLFWFAYRYQYKKTNRAVHFAHSTKLEIIWTAIPAVVMVILVAIGLVNWFKIFDTPPAESLVVEATGQQFLWHLRYSGEDNVLGSKSVYDIGSDNPFGMDWKDQAGRDDFKSDTLMMQLNQPILVKINSLDVLHSFYLPHFRVKMDAVPGIPTQFWFIPTKTTQEARDERDDQKFEFELACAELCGASHFNMRRVVRVLEEDDFKAWKAKQVPIYTSLGIAEKLEELEKAKNEENNSDNKIKGETVGI